MFYNSFKDFLYQCECRATHKDNLTCHIQSVYEGAKYQYNQCEYRDAVQCNLIYHIQLVHEEAKYNCN